MLGFTPDGMRCMDNNECLSNNGHGPCQDTCTNTHGSFVCSCQVCMEIIMDACLDHTVCTFPGNSRKCPCGRWIQLRRSRLLWRLRLQPRVSHQFRPVFLSLSGGTQAGLRLENVHRRRWMCHDGVSQRGLQTGEVRQYSRILRLRGKTMISWSSTCGKAGARCWGYRKDSALMSDILRWRSRSSIITQVQSYIHLKNTSYPEKLRKLRWCSNFVNITTIYQPIQIFRITPPGYRSSGHLIMLRRLHFRWRGEHLCGRWRMYWGRSLRTRPLRE